MSSPMKDDPEYYREMMFEYKQQRIAERNEAYAEDAECNEDYESEDYD